MIGVYTITNLINNKVYIGYSINIKQRLNKHKYTLKSNIHGNIHLQNAVNKYGIINFKFEVLEECSENLLCSQENYWCNLLNVHNRKYGYNIAPTHPEEINKSSSIETRIKQSLAHKGITTWNKNIPMSEETKVKQRLTRVGISCSEETKLKISKSHPSKRKVLRIEDNIIFESVTKAAKHSNTFTSSINKQIKGEIKSLNNYTFKYID